MLQTGFAREFARVTGTCSTCTSDRHLFNIDKVVTHAFHSLIPIMIGDILTIGKSESFYGLWAVFAVFSAITLAWNVNRAGDAC